MRIKDVSKDIATNALWDIIKIILGFLIVSTSSLLTSKFLADSVQVLNEYRYYLIVITTSISLLLFIVIYQKINKNKPKFPNLEFDFLVLRKEVTIDFSSRKNMIYKKNVLLRALRNDIHAYNDKYHWTGSDEVNIKSTIKGQKFQKTLKKNIFQYYEILFRHDLKKGETIETELLWNLSDINKKMVPFISATIEEPTELLQMEVIFPESIKIENVVCEISSSIGKSKSFHVEKIELDRDKKAIWEIRNPSLLYHYEMSWVF